MTRLALLFDLDGTLVDTDHLHFEAFAVMLAEATGRTLTLAEYKSDVMGRPNTEIAAHFFPNDLRAEALINTKEAKFREALAADVPPVAGIHALLDWAAETDTATAVVTNAPRRNAVAMLEATGLAPRLTELVIGEECARAKPDPLPYQEAMRRLGVTPSASVAFEDSRSGLRAARASGAHVFGLTTGLPAAELLQAGAHQTITDFTDPALWATLLALKARVA